ncbi:hypothetical protein GA0115255_100144 [Streptomyces sp. Ncost-T6T-2b]|nr:hypothetical protein GA0115255_100144 [Streptomyces sp. Ncost-T6T-2b]
MPPVAFTVASVSFQTCAVAFRTWSKVRPPVSSSALRAAFATLT